MTKARLNLGALTQRVHAKHEYFILEKDGVPVAGMIHVDEMEDYLELRDPGIKKQIAEGYTAYRRGAGRPLDSFLENVKKTTGTKKTYPSGKAQTKK